MFTKISLLALLAPLVAALTVEVPQNPKSSSPITIRWESQAGDPATFSIFLINEVFHDSFGIANNVVPELGEITLTLPVVPARLIWGISDGYTINLVDVGNVNNVFASSSTFSVAENTATDTTSGSSTGTGTGTATTGRSTSTTPSVPSTRPSNTSTSFGVTVTPPASSPTNSASNSTSSASSSDPATSSSAASVPIKINTNVGALAAVVISAIAGAVVVAL
ncbi:hypothetical protein BDZ94DRAFT_1301476 [Collybia nuda]|uniref:Uncharacterized protein n=1 Tax=Collybia nuda TaxID=64659 RepID=A0A9P5XUK5_9AGAR|nr:hypothetical protein BDZ94DRAFT_1301476 [Collybia nuda]